MGRLLMVSLGVLGLCLAAPVLAGGNDQGDNNQGQQGGGRGFGAPEPITLLGLGLGAGAIGVAGWRARRKR